MSERSVVVGGGVLGLSVARALRRQGGDVTLLEASPELGGLASAWQLGPLDDGTVLTWDRHYHVTLLSDRRTRAMLAELDLDDDMRWVQTRTGFYAGDGSLRSVSNAVEFLRLPTLNLLDKARLAGTILYGSRVGDGRRMEQIGVERWLRRWSGRRTFERFWLPLLRAKLGDGYQDASAAFIWATIQRLYAARRSGLKTELFGYLPGGYARVLDTFADALRADGVDVRTAAPVTAVRRRGGGLAVELPGETLEADRVVVTTNAGLAADLCPELTADEAARLRDVRYLGIVCASLVLRRPLAGYYLTYITDPATPFTAVVEMTALVDPAELAGRTLVYLPKYADPGDPLFDASDDEVRRRFLPYLRRLYPDLRDDDVEAFRVSRVRRVFAVPTLGYSARMPPVRTSIPGLSVLGSAQLPFATLNVDDTLGLVEQILTSS